MTLYELVPVDDPDNQTIWAQRGDDYLGMLVPIKGVEQWYEDHCYAPNDCVVDGVSVDLSELFGLLGIGGDDE